ncbi:MAG: alpha/beta hydrolase [Bryobacterales bacterium]|nr:alpha/beta hydrolase [Bryobacterales bacterium]
MPRKIETHLIAGPAGQLEALLEEPEHGEPSQAALVCHPHPQHGGTMHNKVVYRTARGLRRAGAVVLRFNYRGVNLSAGSYDHGEGELDDARVALAWLRARYPALPVTVAGFSFGSRIALRLGAEPGAAARRILALGFPTRYGDGDRFLTNPVSRVFVQSTHDEFGPRPAFEEFFARVEGDKRLVWVESADHFFAGALEELESVIEREALIP